MQRYDSLTAYAASKDAGVPADYAIVTDEGQRWRLMVMGGTNDVALEGLSDGSILEVGRVHHHETVSALLDPLYAERQLHDLSAELSRTEVLAALEARPRLRDGELALIDDYRARLRQADEIVRDGRRRSYAVVAVSSLPAIDEQQLHRREQTDYHAVDWARVAAAGNDYLEQGGDPLHSYGAYDAARRQGLSDEESGWVESLFSDPISPSEASFGNGRHRTDALRQQGVVAVVVTTRSELAAAELKAARVRSGTPALSALEATSSEHTTASAPSLEFKSSREL